MFNQITGNSNLVNLEYQNAVTQFSEGNGAFCLVLEPGGYLVSPKQASSNKE